MPKLVKKSLHSYNPEIENEFQNIYSILNFSWKNWTPTYTASGAMTYSTITTNIARYTTFGTIFMFQISAIGTTGGVADTQIRFTLPSDVNIYSLWSGTTNNFGGGAQCVDGAGATGKGGFWSWDATNEVIRVFLDENQNWGLGTERAFTLQGFTEII